MLALLPDSPVVFVGPFEHHSNLLPWRESCAEVVTIGEDASGCIDVAELEGKLRKFAGRRLKIGARRGGNHGVDAPVSH